MTPEQQALVALGQVLRLHGYAFVAVTPETHARVLARDARASTLRDVFGWNLPFDPAVLPDELLPLLRAAGALEEVAPQRFRSRIRFATLGERLFAHSAFPTVQADAVFFGPDTYRFCALLDRTAPAANRALDLGCGSGAGGLSIAQRCGTLVLSDINPRALELAEVNAALAAATPLLCLSDVLRSVEGQFDLILANPPYMRDAGERTYRDGGADYGAALSVRIVEEALPRLAAGGTLIVYTGSAIVRGRDTFRARIEPALRACSGTVVYEELDPDVFGEALAESAYADVERIAVVGLRVRVR